MKRNGYSPALVILALLWLLAATAGPALALPSTDATIVDPYKDGRNVTLGQLSNKTATNSPQEPSREHDPSKTQAQLETTLTTDANLGFLTGGPHGRYADNTAACGRCHQLHQAQGQRLIRFNTMPVGSTANNVIFATCTFCHSFNGQSTYDVKDGMIWDTNDGKRYATSGGGFERMLVVEGEPAVATVAKASSSHRVNYATGTKFRPPGGYAGANTGGHIELTCASCHNPHGSRHGRQLRDKVLVGTPAGTTMLRDTSDLDIVYGGTQQIKIQVQSPYGNEQVSYNDQITRFCATCHWDYKATTAVSKTGAYDLKYRHKMGMGPNEGLNDGSKGFGYTSAKFELPLATIDMGPPGVVACITCHYAHGTFAVVNGISATDSIIISSADNSLDLQNLDGTKTEPPKNLRMDNRGVCQNCHNWPDVNTTPLALQDVLDPNQSGTVLYGEPGTLLAGTKILSPTPDTVTIRFNQYVLKGTAAPNSAEYTGNYTLVRTSDSAPVAISSATVQPEGRTVVLRLGSNLVTGTTYTLTVQNVQDTNFVAMNLFSQNFTK
ncbi:MAG: Ig-like domain-containing protein [Clostridia bacterium]|nr:Ig-like domain-containing protein [Clostridia bacterium]